MEDKTRKLLGLMRKANAIQLGETNTLAAVRGGKGQLLLLAADASDNARKRAQSASAGRRVPMVTLPYTKQQIAESAGASGCSMAAVTDLGFANALMKLLAAQDEAFGQTAEQLRQEWEKAERGSSGARPGGRNKRIGKRRTIA